MVTQILFPLLYSATSVASAVNTKHEKASHREVLAKIQSNLPELTSKQTEDAHSMTGDELLAQSLNKSAQIISADNRLDAVENLAQSTAYGFASTQMTNWLNQYGNATIQISSDKAFSDEYFLPVYETEDNLFFSQSRIQRQDEDRTTLNLGLGYRYFMTNKMWGINSFYDHDLKNHNARWGLGAELGADYIKLAANGYFRLTDWRQSRLSAFHDYDERPANGFDIRAEVFLPSYPQLGANIKYEKYFGDKVNLKGSNSISDLKTSPQAYIVGISYTPVPLLSFSLNQSMGDVKETKGELAINYRFGVPLSQQLDTDLVPQMRTLMGARYNPVDRNNTIVMQYQKQDLLRIGFKETSYKVNNEKMVTIDQPSIYKNKYNVAYVVYESKNELFDGQKSTTLAHNQSLKFTPPPFNSTSNNAYEINAYAVDVNGNRSNTVQLNIEVFNNNSDENGDNNTVGLVYEKNSSIWFEVNGIETNEVRSYENNVETIVVKLKLHDKNDNPVKLNDVKVQMKPYRGMYFPCEAVSNKEGEYDCKVSNDRWGIEQFEYSGANNVTLTTAENHFYWDKIEWYISGDPNNLENENVQFKSTLGSFKGTSLNMYTMAGEIVKYNEYDSASLQPFDFEKKTDVDYPYKMEFSARNNVGTKTCLFDDYKCEVY